jgi:hypothetical protein
MAVQFTVADRLFGADGQQRVSDWLDGQAGYIDNIEFTRSFAGRFTVPGVAVDEYSHRHVQSPSGELLGGVRFYNRDVRSPFVEVIAHSFTGLEQVRDCVRDEWSSFRPRFVRLRTAPEKLAREPNARLHKSIHVARYADLRTSDGQVTLEPFDDVDDAIALVDRRYDHLRSADPDLGTILAPADPDELREWHDNGQLFAIRAQGETVGALAIVPSRVGWIDGEEVNEKVIDAGHNGHGYAAAAQSAWAEQIATDRNVLLIGTIHGNNAASRKTAESAGRVRVLDDYDVAL